MGDNIKDAELKGTAAPVARNGWTALADAARSRDVLAADYGSTCLRLTGGSLLIDRTAGFSEDEFYRARREYQKFGITDVWVVGPKSGASSEFLNRNSGSVLIMMHADRRDSRFVINGVRHSLDEGLEYIMTGKVNTAPARSKVKLVNDRLHRNSVRKLALRPETAAVL